MRARAARLCLLYNGGTSSLALGEDTRSTRTVLTRLATRASTVVTHTSTVSSPQLGGLSTLKDPNDLLHLALGVNKERC